MGEEVVTKPAGKVPRGIRQNNPGNIRHGEHWQGLAPEQPDPDFARFVSPVWGLRAMCRVLIQYQKRHNRRTVNEIIGRWAPPTENDTMAYQRSVAVALGVLPDEPIDVSRPDTMRALVKAIIRHENGMQPYEDSVIDEAMKKAGIV